MSGRDFKSFLSSHQYQMGRQADPKLVTKCIGGTNIGTYKKVDYEQLTALAKLKKSAGERSLKKLNTITKSSRDKKENSLMQQHKKIWLKEQVRLKHMIERIENDVEISISRFSNSDWTFLTDLYFEITSLSESLKDSRIEFEGETVKPILDLRDDLRYWLKENREKLILGIAAEEHREVKNVYDSVQSQQKRIVEQLEKNEHALKSEIEALKLALGIEQVDMKFPHVLSGIPDEACELECYDDDLKGNCLAEFHNLDRKHELHFEYLEEKYHEAVQRAPTGRWSAADHFKFQHILDQYSDEKQDRRLLYIDRLTRQLSHKTRSQIVEHENWWFAFKSFQNQFRDQLYSWQRDRDDLFIKIKAVFAEANSEHEAEIERVADRQKQAYTCEELHQKVKLFQIEKMKIMKLEAAALARKEEEENENRKMEELREKNRRSKMKTKIDKYRDEKEQQRQRDIDNETRLLNELKAKADEQSVIDKERIEYRETLVQERNQQMLLAKERRLEEEKEKEERLEKLRMQVRVEAPSDPTRLLEPTEAYQSKQAAKLDDEKELQEPLFTLHTFNVTQVNADQRVKTENALRQAGLHNSDYARHVLSKIAPPTLPRKDTSSSIFK